MSNGVAARATEPRATPPRPSHPIAPAPATIAVRGSKAPGRRVMRRIVAAGHAGAAGAGAVAAAGAAVSVRDGVRVAVKVRPGRTTPLRASKVRPSNRVVAPRYPASGSKRTAFSRWSGMEGGSCASRNSISARNPTMSTCHGTFWRRSPATLMAATVPT